MAFTTNALPILTSCFRRTSDVRFLCNNGKNLARHFSMPGWAQERGREGCFGLTLSTVNASGFKDITYTLLPKSPKALLIIKHPFYLAIIE